MTLHKTLFAAFVLAFFSNSNLHADDIGIDFPAASYDFESKPDDPYVIRTLGSKVGYIKADPVQTEHWGYDSFDFGDGAETLTVRAASATEGGTLVVRIRNANNPSLTIARVDIPNTGGWDQFQEFTVEVDAEVIEYFGANSPSLFFAVERSENAGYLFDVESFRFDNPYKGLLWAADYDAESYPSDDNIIRDMGTQIGYITNFSWVVYNGYSVPVDATSLTVFASSATNGGTVHVTTRAPYGFGGNLVASVDISNTGGWDEFQEFSVDLTGDASDGNNRLFLSFEGDENYLFDIQALRFDTN